MTDLTAALTRFFTFFGVEPTPDLIEEATAVVAKIDPPPQRLRSTAYYVARAKAIGSLKVAQ